MLRTEARLDPLHPLGELKAAKPRESASVDSPSSGFGHSSGMEKKDQEPEEIIMNASETESHSSSDEEAELVGLVSKTLAATAQRAPMVPIALHHPLLAARQLHMHPMQQHLLQQQHQMWMQDRYMQARGPLGFTHLPLGLPLSGAINPGQSINQASVSSATSQQQTVGRQKSANEQILNNETSLYQQQLQLLSAQNGLALWNHEYQKLLMTPSISSSFSEEDQQHLTALAEATGIPVPLSLLIPPNSAALLQSGINLSKSPTLTAPSKASGASPSGPTVSPLDTPTQSPRSSPTSSTGTGTGTSSATASGASTNPNTTSAGLYHLPALHRPLYSRIVLTPGAGGSKHGAGSLIVGDALTSSDAAWLVGSRVTTIINAASELPDYFTHTSIKYYRAEIPEKSSDWRPVDYDRALLDAAAKINEALSQGSNVLVHCAAGVNRAPSIILVYIMAYEGRPLSSALELMKTRLAILKMSDTSKSSLMRTEKHLFNLSTVNFFKEEDKNADKGSTSSRSSSPESTSSTTASAVGSAEPSPRFATFNMSSVPKSSPPRPEAQNKTIPSGSSPNAMDIISNEPQNAAQTTSSIPASPHLVPRRTSLHQPSDPIELAHKTQSTSRPTARVQSKSTNKTMTSDPATPYPMMMGEVKIGKPRSQSVPNIPTLAIAAARQHNFNTGDYNPNAMPGQSDVEIASRSRSHSARSHPSTTTSRSPRGHTVTPSASSTSPTTTAPALFTKTTKGSQTNFSPPATPVTHKGAMKNRRWASRAPKREVMRPPSVCTQTLTSVQLEELRASLIVPPHMLHRNLTEYFKSLPLPSFLVEALNAKGCSWLSTPKEGENDQPTVPAKTHGFSSMLSPPAPNPTEADAAFLCYFKNHGSSTA